MADGLNHPNALFAAVSDGGPEEVSAALTAGAALAERDEDDWSPLDRAAGRGDPDIVSLLLDGGADPSAVGREQRTAYEIALAAGHVAAARLLREAEERADPQSAERHQWRPYCRAYRLEQLRAFTGWRESSDGAPLDTDAVVYLHDDLTVTRMMWPGEDVVFDDRSDGWARFCAEVLQFTVPDDFDLLPTGAS